MKRRSKRDWYLIVGIAIVIAELIFIQFLLAKDEPPDEMKAYADQLISESIFPITGEDFLEERNPTNTLEPSVFKQFYRDDNNEIVWWNATINEHGYRFNSSAPGTRIIILVGDSHSFGYGLGDNKTFAYKLEHMFGGQRRIINLAVPGDNLVQKVSRLKQWLVYEPEIVIFQAEGGDDSIYSYAEFEKDILLKFLHQFGADSIYDSQDVMTGQIYLVTKLRDKFDEKYRKDIMETRERAFDELDALSRQRNFTVITISTWLSGNSDYEVFSRIYGWEDAGSGIPNSPISFYERHYNEEANTRIAEELYDLIADRP